MTSNGVCQMNIYSIVGTGQTNSYNNTGVIGLPATGQSYNGQNTNYPGNAPSYTDNGNGTITDNVTGLVWEETPDKNGDGTITDNATGLMWLQNDNGTGILWENALTFAESYTYAGYSDWRLPDIKELQSIVDYSRSPATSNSAAIDPLFNCTQITNEGGVADYPYYWSATTFCSQTIANGTSACYVPFGRALGYMSQFGGWVDVHGAGAQRSDPKTGDPNNYPTGFGPQGDAIRIYNYIRLVRSLSAINGIGDIDKTGSVLVYPNPVSDHCSIKLSSKCDKVEVFIYDPLGKMVREYIFSETDVLSVDLYDLPPGFYTISVAFNGNNSIQKIIKLQAGQ